MNTPRPKFFCPQCRTAYTVEQNFCGRCGTDMKHVSGLAYAAQNRRPSSARPAAEPDAAISLAATEEVTAIRERRETTETAELPAPSPQDRRTGGRDPWLGRIIDGRYKVIEVLGRGGMGLVYKVEHQRMGKIAAMKVLHGELADDPEVMGRFRREAEAVSRLTHPNTVQVFDFGVAQGALYLIMEYVRGLDLGTLVKRDGALPFDRAAPLLGQICSALDEAHGLGVVHRDLKPENILVTRTHAGRDFVKVLDFGLAKLTERPDAAEVTDRGSIVGTPYYMSPEQIRGEEEVDARSDIYSLGGLMYKVLTGEPAFTAKTPVGVLTKHLTADLVPPSERRPDLEIAPRVDAIVARAMAKDREQRYGSAREMLEDLEAVYAELEGLSPSGGMASLSLSGFASSPSRRGPAGAPPLIEVDDVDYGVDTGVRLQRSDIDDFERAIVRRRRLGVALVVLLFGGAAGMGVYWFAIRTEPPQTSEIEPNDDTTQATLIAPDTQVTGYLGKRQSRSEPDRDVYRLSHEPMPGEAVSVEVSGLPNVDVELQLLDAAGAVLHQRNQAGVGEGERIRDWRVHGQVMVAVTEHLGSGDALPVENVSDPYTLTVSLRAPGAGVEVEPDDAPTDALPLAVGGTMTGYLDRRGDVDTFRFDGAAGDYTLRIGGAGSVPLSWRVGGGEPRSERQARITLAPGSLIRLSRTDARAPATDGPPPGADEPYALELGR